MLRAERLVVGCWLVFVVVNATLMFLEPGRETIPYHLIWASFAFLYGIVTFAARVTWWIFAAITVVTGIPLILHARSGVIGWEECSEIVLMGVIAAFLVWHVNRHRSAVSHIAELRENERVRSHNRELATRFGSHELRTRLTIARGLTDLIRETSDDPAARSDATLALSELDKATVLATNLMTLVRVDGVVAMEPVDIDEMIDTIGRRWAARAPRDWQVRRAVGFVLGNAERLESCLDCLLENAVKFTEDGDRIAIDAHLDGPDLVIAVSDSGAGIPPDEVGSVTELFRTGRAAGERAGSGLGLPIVRTVVEARGGSLHVSSELGTGTTMTIRVPHGNLSVAQAIRSDVDQTTAQVVHRPNNHAVRDLTPSS